MKLFVEVWLRNTVVSLYSHVYLQNICINPLNSKGFFKNLVKNILFAFIFCAFKLHFLFPLLLHHSITSLYLLPLFFTPPPPWQTGVALTLSLASKAKQNKKTNQDMAAFCLLKCHFNPQQAAGGDPVTPWNGFKAPGEKDLMKFSAKTPARYGERGTSFWESD